MNGHVGATPLTCTLDRLLSTGTDSPECFAGRGLSRVHRAVVLGRTCSHRSARPVDQALSSRSVRRLSADPTPGRRGREFKSPPPDQVRGGFRCWGREPANLCANQRGPNLLLVRGHKRFKSGAWRLTVNAKDPVTGERKPVTRRSAPPTTRGVRPRRTASWQSSSPGSRPGGIRSWSI
jgi:hypothetical protein